jgi:hypothetical protein
MIFPTYKAAAKWIDDHVPSLEKGSCQLLNERGDVIPWLGTNVKSGQPDPPWNRLCIDPGPDETHYEVLLCHFPRNSISDRSVTPSLYCISSIRYIK